MMHSGESPIDRDEVSLEDAANGVKSPLEAYSSYHGEDWSPQRLALHQNFETFAEKVGLIVALESGGKMSQERAYSEIRRYWDELRSSKINLLNTSPDEANF
jgi:hypothetical protein